METLRSLRGAPNLPARALGGRPRLTAVAAVQTKQTEASAGRSATPQEEIYIGFTKDEGALARAGRKGRVIKDDPRKYPSRDEFGTGGWAGGEAGLWQLREEVLKEKEKAKATKAQPPKSSPWIPKSAPPGKEVIYVGFNKDELELRKSGAKGRVVVDDPTKYPGKDDIGPLAGVAGGFAGGEAGLKQYVATGTVRLRKPGEPGPRQFSPLTLAGLIALAGAVGGIVLDLVTDAGEGSGSAVGISQLVPLDRNTEYLILGSVGFVLTSSLLIAINAAVKALGQKLRDNAGRAIITAIFLGLVVLAAYGVIES